jgi:hypothetical protein
MADGCLILCLFCYKLLLSKLVITLNILLHTNNSKIQKFKMIDLPTRKLNLIQYLAQSQDEVFLETLEQLILKKEGITKNNYSPFTVEELIERIEKSELDIRNGKYKTQEDLEKISANW